MCSIDSLFGGPSKQEKQIGAQSQGLASAMEGDFNTVFGEQQSTLKDLKDELTRINTGDTGMGFSAEENALLMTGIETGAAGAERNALQAEANRVAGRNLEGRQGGEVESGAQQAIKAGIIAGGEEAKARGLNAETLENIRQGRANAITTASGLGQLAGLENPEGYGKMAGNENQVAFKEANTLNAQHNSAIGGMMKALTGAAGIASDVFGLPDVVDKVISGGSGATSGSGGSGGGSNSGDFAPVNFGQ